MEQDPGLRRLARLTLAFAVSFAFFSIAPALLNQPLGIYPLLNVGDALDLLTPLVLVPLYWMLFQAGGDGPPGRREAVVFLVLAALWVEGQGLHLAANAIGHLTGEMPGSGAAALAHFIDETLSHYLWHLAAIGLSALLIWRGWRHPFAQERAGLGLEIAAGIVYGFSYFLVIVEGGTAPLGVPFAVVAAVAILLRGRRDLRRRPLLAFFLVACLAATCCFLTWGLLWGGLPEFSQVGLIE